MSFPRYPKYKASGVEWLGEVPEHWSVWKLTHAFEKIGSGTTPKTDNKEYYDDGTHPWINTGDLNDEELTNCEKKITSRALSEHTTLRVYPAGSVVIAMYGATIGKLAILQFPASVNQACCVFSGKQKIEYKFLFFWLLGFRPQIISLAFGGGQPNVNQDILRGLRVVCPDLIEQTAIAEFLDRETLKVDRLVAEQRRLMELLKEKRQAVISHAVTKGLNPHAPMKPSGIEWLGDVPDVWKVVPLGILVIMIQTGPFGSQLHSSEYVENGTPVINPSNIQDGRIEPDWSCSITPEDAGRLSQHKLMEGDIVFGRRGEMGRCALVSCNEIGWICGTESLNIRLSNRAFPPFIATYLRTEYVREWLKLQSVGSTMDNLNTQILGAINVPLPPLEEQKSIASFIEAELAKFDTLTAETQRAIDLLQERRTALISAAVTGQIDVRQLVRSAA